MCGWEVWLGMYRREGGAGALLSFCPSGPALFGQSCWSRPRQQVYGGFGSVSTVADCFGGPIMSRWKLAERS